VVFILPCIDNMRIVDLRTKSFNVGTQEVMTKDSVTVLVDGAVYYRIINPVNTIVQIKDFDSSTLLIAQSTLRNVIGTKQLFEVLISKGELSKLIAAILADITSGWGIRVERVELYVKIYIFSLFESILWLF